MTFQGQLRVAMGDLRHRTVGRHSVFMPVGLGYIGSYALSQLGSENLSLRLFDDPDDMLDAIDEWEPHIVALANYCWNSEISQLVMRFAKRQRPATICISGGPDFPQTHEECLAYLNERPQIDFYAYREGEIPFARLLETIRSGASVDELKSQPQVGMMSVSPSGGALVVGPEAPRLMNMDETPSPYLNGMMDQWFDGRFAPCVETARGCPFTCTFCVQGESIWTKVGRFSVDRMKAEFTYMAERMQGHEEVLLGLFDANFGMYDRDEELALHLRKLQDTYHWPNAFEVTTGKARYDRILKIADILQNKMIVTCSVQSWNAETLDLIERRNLPPEKYREIVAEVKRRGQRAVAECIVPLPAESKESFLKGLRFLVESGVETITAYTTMMLHGTQLSARETRKKYEMQTHFRVLPRQFGTYRGERCFEIEEVCVATNTMSFEDYLECRGFAFIATVFSAVQYDVCHRLLAEMGGNVFDWLLLIWNDVKSGNSPISPIYNDFVHESGEELFPTKQAIAAHFGRDEEYRKLLAGEVGDNLMRKYTTRVVLEQCTTAIHLAFGCLQRVLNVAPGQNAMIEAVREWMIAVRDVGSALRDPQHLKSRAVLELAWDVEAWYRQGRDGKPLSDFCTPVRYELFCNQEKVQAFLEQHHQLYGSLFLLASKFFIYHSSKDLWRQINAVIAEGAKGRVNGVSLRHAAPD